MYRVGPNVATATFNFDLDHHQIVNVFKIFTNCLFGESRVAATNNKIPSRSETNLACDMAWQDKLAIVPTYINLVFVRTRSNTMLSSVAYPFLFDVQIMPANIIKEGTSIGGLEERDCCRAIHGPQVDVQQLSPANDFGNITVSDAFGKIAQQQCPGTLALVKWPGCGLLVRQLAAIVATRYAARCRAILLRNVDVSPIGRFLEIDLGIRFGSRVVRSKVSWGAVRLMWAVLLSLLVRGGVRLDGRRGCSLFNRSIILAEKLSNISIKMSRLYGPGHGQ